jgi:Polyketide cyclase / dehydrase and lipid transport
MWRQVEVRTRIEHPVDQVFGYLVDPLRWHDFAPACIYRRQIGGGRPVVGTQWSSIDMIGPVPYHFVDTLAELEPNRRVVWLSSAPWNARVEYLCEPDAGGTRIVASYEGDISGSLRFLVGWLPTAVTHWILAQDFRRLSRILDRRGRVARPAFTADAVPSIATHPRRESF